MPTPPPRFNDRLPRVDHRAPESDYLWPLDLSVVTLGGLVVFLVLKRFRFDDPRLLHNALTYLVVIALISLGLAFFLRAITSRYLQKSIQLGFLSSVCLHMLMMIFAVNIIVFSSFQPIASKGETRRRNPIRKTIPEHIFQAPTDSAQTPDWSKPVDAETTSRVVPREQRQLPPVNRSRPRLEVPKPRQSEIQPMKKSLMERQTPTAAQPMPADAPGQLSRRIVNKEPTPQIRAVDVPSDSKRAEKATNDSPMPRELTSSVPSGQSRLAPSRLDRSSAQPQPLTLLKPTKITPPAVSGAPENVLVARGEAGLVRMRRSRSISRPAAVAGAAPAPLDVSVARISETASLRLAPTATPISKRGDVGAQISQGRAPSFMADPTRSVPTVGSEVARNAFAAKAGSPTVNAGLARAAPGRSQRTNVTSGFSPVGAFAAAESLPASANGDSGQSTSDSIEDRLGSLDMMSDRSGGQRQATELTPSGASDLTLDLMSKLEGIGIGQTPAESVGLMASELQPQVASMELPREGRPRKSVGGPATPAGTEIAAVESFSRRMQRTSGGAASSAPGVGGPATEEAIERGLAYLSRIQNEDGSWSLQGHGDPIMLRSDTAATGLCLLAFQGAGYTHLQHQHAETVSKGLKWLIDNQRSSGNLYRREDKNSDGNVMFYSHGIASLAMCEAYGMTQDRELRRPAQDALNYIIKTQHHIRGGWRYVPQFSSDTSVTGWMMMALKSGELAGLEVPQETYHRITEWLDEAQDPDRSDLYRYDPYAPDTDAQRHGRNPTPTMTAVGILMRMYNGWRRNEPAMKSAAEYLLHFPPRLSREVRRGAKVRTLSLRDGYYWYYATQVMFHMGGDYWERWNRYLNPLLLDTQITVGPEAGSWDPNRPTPDLWAPYAGRVYVTTMNLLNLEVYYRHLPIYEDTAAE